MREKMKWGTNGMSIVGDNPIRAQEEDALGRFDLARSFAQQVLALDTANGVVVGVLGLWGSGKTSFVNLARDEFTRAGVPILDFNPWMFSGAEQLVESFFVELAAQLKVLPGLSEVGKGLEDYGEAFSGMGWLPLVGPWMERASGAAKVLGKVLQNRKQGIGGRRATVDKALAELGKPIVVVLDDIDRLSTTEIRDVFKLVRLTASFPNIVYIVAFDRDRVEEALAEQGVPGRAYLEKILQVAVDLPVVPFQVLNHQIFTAVDSALAGIENPGRFDDQVWPDAFMEIIRPLIRNMRDVRRYAAAIYGTANSLGGQIALADVLSLEAIRVFLPDVFKLLHGTLNALTNVGGGHRESPQMKVQIEALFAAGGLHKEVVQAMIERLFPAAQRHISNMHYGADWKGRWLRERRVAHEDILRFYLERVAGEGLKSFTDAEQAGGPRRVRSAPTVPRFNAATGHHRFLGEF
jgi:predicted KAP-like P-loop ATPase